MFGRMMRSQRAMYFIGGAVSATLGVRLFKSPAGRRMCVRGLAEGMRLQKRALETLRNMREEAADICCEAKSRAEQ